MSEGDLTGVILAKQYILKGDNIYTYIIIDCVYGALSR